MDKKENETMINQLMLAMLLSSMSRKENEKPSGLVFNEDSKIVIDTFNKQTIWTWHGESQELPIGQLCQIATADPRDNMTYVEVIGQTEDGVIHLKAVQFFNAKVTDGRNPFDLCVAATDRTDAFKLLKAHAKTGGYTRAISVLPAAKPFQPVLTQTMVTAKE